MTFSDSELTFPEYIAEYSCTHGFSVLAELFIPVNE